MVNRNTKKASTLHKILSVRQTAKQFHFLKGTKKLANDCLIIFSFYSAILETELHV
jgi:hypothetical protein